ncbi:unnamed protein product, partial [Mesorhabditis spiculigera]
MLRRILVLISLIAAVSAIFENLQQRRNLQQMNPVARSRVSASFRQRLHLLNAVAQKREEEERTRTDKYRNCFLSPVQCRMPANYGEKNPLLTALLPRASHLNDAQLRVRISLYDHDSLPWESDDLMGRTYTDIDGKFVVEGCGDDFGPWNDPDPYIVVEHRCPYVGHTVAITHRKTIVDVWKTFMPMETSVGLVRLDLNQEG